MDSKKRIEIAIERLQLLLDSRIVEEIKYQQWFENNDVIFSLMGYKNFISHPELITKNGQKFIPDFLCQTIDGSWVILELKRPDTLVLKSRSRRVDFYAELNGYISQCFEYSEYFDDEINREAFQKRYNVHIQKSLRSVLIAGRNNGFDKEKVHKILINERSGKIDLITYDDIIERLNFIRTELHSQWENKKGISIHLVCKPSIPKFGKGYILDLGQNIKKNRISIYVTKNAQMVFNVIGDNSIDNELIITEEESKHIFNQIIYLSLEIGFSNQYTFIVFEINGKYYRDIKLDNFVIDLSEIFSKTYDNLIYVLGADMYGENNAEVLLLENIIYSRTLEFWEKYELKKYFYSKEFKGLNFIGDGFATSENHPNF